MVRDDDGTQAGLSERALDAEDLPDEAFFRELDAVVDLLVLDEEVLGQRIEKIERVELLPGHRGHIRHLKACVRHSKLEARAPRRLDQVRALLDADEVEPRRGARRGQHELSAAGADIENAMCTGVVQEVRRATGDGDGRPKASREEADARWVHCVEGIIVGTVGVRDHHRCGRKHRTFQAAVAPKNHARSRCIPVPRAGIATE